MDTFPLNLSYKKGFMRKYLLRIYYTGFNKELTAIYFAVYNNIYNLEFLLIFDFEKNHNFECWLVESYSSYVNKRKYNFYLRDVFYSIGSKGYSYA